MLSHLTVFFVFIFSFLVSVEAHRSSDIDNLTECEWNKRAVNQSDLRVECNDLYHLYTPKSEKSFKRSKDIKLAAFNLFNLGSGDARFKDLDLTAKIIDEYDVIAISEAHPSTSEEFDSNINLKRSDLNFQEYYHKPGYLDLLYALRKINSSWALVISPAAQSDNQELMGFYFKTEKVKLDNSEYCELYNRKLRDKKTLYFSDSYKGPTFGRRSETPYLKDSFACLLDIEKSENAISRVPFMARFETGGGFDFNYLSFHARFGEPIAVGGTCGYECLEQINIFFNEEFHKGGDFIPALDLAALGFLNNHIDYLAGSGDLGDALNKNYSPVIKFKNSKPRVYENMMGVKSLMEESLKQTAYDVWKADYEGDLPAKTRDEIVDELLKLSKNEIKKDDSFFKTHNKFIEQTLNSPPFSDVKMRYDMWTSPSKVARFYEVTLSLAEMEKMAEYERDSDVLLGGDLNLEPDANKEYWDYLSNNYKYSNVGISSPTTISKRRGLVRSYDHFLYSSKNSLEECHPIEANVVDFVNDRSYWDGFEYYFVKSGRGLEEVSDMMYEKISNIQYVNRKGVAEYTTDINVARGYRSCWNNQTYKNTPLADEWRNDFECKTLRHYLENDEKYRIYTDIISDHIPISMKCNDARDID